MKLTDVLDAVGVLCLAGCAFFIWPPAALGVVGAVLLLASWQRERKGRS